MPTMCHFATPVMKLLLIVLFVYHPFSHLLSTQPEKDSKNFIRSQAIGTFRILLIINLVRG